MEISTRDNALSASAMPGNQDGTLGKVSSLAHAAVDSAADSAGLAANKAKPAIDQVAGMAHKTLDRAAGAVAPVSDWLAAKGESLNATQKRVTESTCQYVAGNPLKSIGIALAAGFLLSRIIKK